MVYYYLGMSVVSGLVAIKCFRDWRRSKKS